MAGRRKTRCFHHLNAWAAVLILSGSQLCAAAREINDKAVAGAVENELLHDEAVFLPDIDISVEDGVVSLTGTADNILEKERATRVAETVKGVRAVVNRIEVRPSGRSDRQIKEDVSRALKADPATDSFEISVSVDQGTVTLKGVVDSWAASDVSERVAKGVTGVLAVNNLIRVDYTTDRPDGEIRTDIQDKLDWDVLVDERRIDVAVRSGEVTLSGTVGSAAEQRRARIDAWVAGVTSVDVADLKVRDRVENSDLREETLTPRKDNAIRAAVKKALEWDPRVNSFAVTPEVSNGRVTLRGTVDYLKARRAAAQDARNTVGVTYVRNRLKVKVHEEISDAAVKGQVETALRRDPYLKEYKITADVDHGIVHLYGAVNSYFEKSEADDVASRVGGVVFVDNNLVVDDDLYVYDPYVDEPFVYDYDWYDYTPNETLRRSDADIKESIEDELWWSPFVDSDQIEVSVINGVATLTGTVDSASDRRIAAENALQGGAVEVNNELVVQ